MPHYFFDTRNNNGFIEDDIGLELPDLEAARREATLSLAELARDVVAGRERWIAIVEVREGVTPVLEARLTFEAVVLPN